MSKIIFILAVFLSAAIISCSGDSDSDVSVGYIDPGLDSPKTVKSKSYSFNSSYINESCPLGPNCNAIIYQGALNNIAYTGIAVNDKHDGSPDFTFKMYWVGSSLPEASATNTISGTAEYIKINNDGAAEQSASSVPFNITIKNEDDGTYTITFITSNITVGTQSIRINDTIRAYKYP